MENRDLTLRKLNNTSFPQAYEEFLLNKHMNRTKYLKILEIATLFINSVNQNIKKLGYRIILVYCNRTNEYKPLYEIAVNTGLTPIAHFIENNIMNNAQSNIFIEMNAIYNKRFFINNIYYSLEQKNLIEFYDSNVNDSLSIVAPTSYGKTDLILSTINEIKEKNICVITPTKSLLLQTKMRIQKNMQKYKEKIITYPEMYTGEERRIIAVMTQERLLRFLKKRSKLQFDYVIIDEAHNLLKDDARNLLLASVILALKKRNKNTIFKFLTPFLYDAENIKLKYVDYTLKTYKIQECIKIEKIYLAELRSGYIKRLQLYDQFMNRFYNIQNLEYIDNEWKFVKKFASDKNIIYFNKPKDIENFIDIINNENKEEITEEIERACKNIAEYIHPKYRMIESIQRGVIYHHGAVPEPIRIYIEKLYAKIKSIKYVVTSSTLLEGVTLPADKMFLLDNKKGRAKLTSSDLKNLIGRICRFNRIFHSKTGNLLRLEPCIYMVVGKYYSVNANVENFISNTMYVEKKEYDEIKNVLLEKTIITDKNKVHLKEAKEFVENYEEGIIDDPNLRKAETEIGKICFANNITELSIFDNENYLEEYMIKISSNDEKISDTEYLLQVLYEMFFSKIEDDRISRFRYKETRNFYKMFLDWRINNTPLNEMINSFIRYWKHLIKEEEDTIIYVGRWGDTVRNGRIPLWVDIANKSDVELINLAIVRIKEEQDFLDNVIIKYIEVLNDIKLIDENLYLNIKYGTNDKMKITCTKNGISSGLAKIIIEKYMNYIKIDVEKSTIQFSDGILEAMKTEKENEILVCELEYFL